MSMHHKSKLKPSLILAFLPLLILGCPPIDAPIQSGDEITHRYKVYNMYGNLLFIGDLAGACLLSDTSATLFKKASAGRIGGVEKSPTICVDPRAVVMVRVSDPAVKEMSYNDYITHQTRVTGTRG